MRIAIIGNSGSGKSTLARKLAHKLTLQHASDGDIPVLDLDTLVWEPGQIAQPRDPAVVMADLQQFCESNPHWIIEGCYADCISAALAFEPELVFLEPGLEVCLEHCRKRPWEPHKYASKAEQDAKLEFLLAWVADYYVRDGNMSLQAHQAVFDGYAGPKRMMEACP